MDNREKKCDLHIHSVFSDSDAGLEDIFRRAVSSGVNCISVTDHDTAAGIKQSRLYAADYGIELVPGIELSAHRGDIEVHILGYFINEHDRCLLQALEEFKESRKCRIAMMAKRLVAQGLDVDRDELFAQIGSAIPTRLHLAIYMIKKGIVTNLWEAFRKYLSYGRPAYVSRFTYSVEDAINLIKSCGGLSFLAHPQYITDPSWIEEFVSHGLDGIEVVYPRYDEKTIDYYTDIASKFNLLKSGGSDAHGSYKEFTQIGKVNVPYAWVQDMKIRLARAHLLR